MNQIKTSFFKFAPSYFFYTISFICISYLLFEYFFVPYGVLSADEFVFARHIYEYTFHLPYRDFPPYKTVLGYYLLSLPMFFSHALLAPIFYIKDEIAIINAVFIALTCYLAASIFDKRAVLITICAIIANQLFIVYATDLRVDMLTSWLCLLSALWILKNDFKLSGFILGIAFLVSQKALWYAIAIDASMFICWYTYRASPFTIRHFFYFNIATAFPIIAYIIVWSCIASPSVVLYNLFYEAYIQAGINWYMPIYLVCWDAILRHGPLLFLLWPATILTLTEKFNNDILAQRRLFVISFAFIALLQFINYRQAFPYNFVLTIPAFFILYADFFTWLLTAQSFPIFKTPSTAFYMFILHGVLIGVVLSSLSIYLYILPPIYYLSILLPCALYAICYFRNNNQHIYSFAFALFLGLFIWLGIFYPLNGALITSRVLNGKYQQTIIELTSNLLDKDERYVGGIPFLYTVDQPIDGMKNLIGPALEYLYQPNDQLTPLLLPSLYLAPSSQEKIIADFDREPVKVILNNYRMLTLPSAITTYINNHYQHFYGSIYLYAPIVFSSQLTFDLKFSGKYRVQAKKTSHIRIDNKRVHANQMLTLTKGQHTSFANNDYRLVLIPDISQKNLVRSYESDDWIKMIKAIIA